MELQSFNVQKKVTKNNLAQQFLPLKTPKDSTATSLVNL